MNCPMCNVDKKEDVFRECVMEEKTYYWCPDCSFSWDTETAKELSEWEILRQQKVINHA